MKRYLPNNWTDGMKINKTHFIGEFNAQTQQQILNNEAFLYPHNYGLLPSINQQKNNLLFLNLDNQQMIELKAIKCNAITSNGIRIAVGDTENQDLGVQLQHEVASLRVGVESLLDLGEDEFYILLSIDPYNRIPYGDIITDETPPRHPYTAPSLKLSIIHYRQLVNTGIANVLPIGKLLVKNNNVSLDDSYIPPCQMVASHESLVDILEQWRVFLSNMEVLSLTIIQKVMQKKQQNELSIPVVQVCESIVQYISTILDHFNMDGLYYTPSKMISTLAGLARTINNTFSMYAGSGEEEVFAYFSEKCGIDQGLYKKVTAEACHIHYNHIDCIPSIKAISSFVTTTRQLFEALASLDYIGKRKEAGIFVKEEALTMKKPGRLGTFLAD
ncbi:MAG: hypothetical protein DI598_04085 [Pseudopedobacter saltans]|uniref:Type VI secretion system baseplate subunit TssK n=1 Tax=Pseudopedobacter saltans TaxID=151895 RepID=A0A2W5FBQ9_9SPHI|nr:MAG: hypothetical protein DI598_04085 [Pseudopedobacter saltans]